MIRTLTALAMAFAGACSPDAPATAPAPSVAEAPAAPQPVPAIESSATSRKVGSTTVFEPVTVLCKQVPAVEGDWTKVPDVALKLFPAEDGKPDTYRIVGRTNLPDGLVLFVGIAGFGGWASEHTLVDGGCIVTPPMDAGAGYYVMDATISDLSALDRQVADQIGEYGANLKHHITDGEFKVQEEIAIGPNAEAAYRDHLAEHQEFEKVVKVLLTDGERWGRLRSHAAEGDTQAGIECAQGTGGIRQSQRMNKPREELERFAKQASLFNSAAVAKIVFHLSECLNCHPESGDKGCGEATKALRAGEWRQDNVVAEFRGRHAAN